MSENESHIHTPSNQLPPKSRGFLGNLQRRLSETKIDEKPRDSIASALPKISNLGQKLRESVKRGWKDIKPRQAPTELDIPSIPLCDEAGRLTFMGLASLKSRDKLPLGRIKEVEGCQVFLATKFSPKGRINSTTDGSKETSETSETKAAESQDTDEK